MNRRAWRPALRVARRDVLRAKGRGALIAAMVGLPVLAVSTFATVYTTDAVSPVEALGQQLGTTQAQVLPVARTALDQSVTGDNWSPVPTSGSDAEPASEAPTQEWTLPELRAAVGRPVIDVTSTGASVRTERGRLSAHVLAVDAASPDLTGVVQLRSGRLPTTGDEALVSPWLAEHGFAIGSRVVVEDAPPEGEPARASAKVVGVAVVPSTFDQSLVVAPPSSPVSRVPAGDVTHTYLLPGPSPVTWDTVRDLNAQGIVVVSRAVVLDPPANWTSTLANPEAFSYMGSVDNATRAVLVLIVFSIVLEVVLLAGPAFAVGVRRQRRQLALVVAAGGTARDVRRIVLAQALVTGALSSVLCAVAGLPLAAAIVWALPRLRPTTTLGPFDVAWTPLLAAAVLGAAAALVAAWFPARSAARQDVVAVLAGRRGQVGSHRGLPLLGLLLLGVGAGVALVRGTKQGGEFYVAGGTLLMVLGAIALMPAVIGLVGRLGRRLPLGLRLATRDSARQRGRTAPAVAAVMAAVAGVTTLAIGASSDFAQRRAEYQPRLASGVTTVQASEVDNGWWAFATQTVSSLVPGRQLLPTGELGRASSTSSWQPGVYIRPKGCPAVPETPDAPPRCTNWQLGGTDDAPSSFGSTNSLVAEPDTLAALGHALDAHQIDVLRGGGVLVPSPALVDPTGHATLTTYETSFTGGAPTVRHLRSVSLPAAALEPREEGGLVTVIGAVVTPRTATAMGTGWEQRGGVLSPSATPLTRDAQGRLAEVLNGSAQYVEVYTERGFDEKFTLPLVGLIAIATIAVLVGTLTATGLALVDGRPDAATLAAVGARPRTRRTMAAAQAAVIGLLGSLTGIAVGVVPGLAVTWPLTANRYDAASGGSRWGSPIIDVPWLLLLVVGVGVPLLGATVAGLSVRSRLPLTRRLGQ